MPASTTVTNGAIESFIGHRKDKEKSFLNLLPANYAIESYPLAIGSCVDFQEIKEKKEKHMSKKRRTSDDEYDIYEAEEGCLFKSADLVTFRNDIFKAFANNSSKYQ